MTGSPGQGRGGVELATCLLSSLGRETPSATFSNGTKGVSNAYSKWLFRNHRFLSRLRENAVKMSAVSASPASSAASIPSRAAARDQSGLGSDLSALQTLSGLISPENTSVICSLAASVVTLMQAQP